MSEKLPFNLLNLLHQRTVESERIEYKEGWNPDPILRTICAFANDFSNLGGGYIIIGQDCDANGQPIFPPCGLEDNQLDKIQQELLACCQTLQPPFTPQYSIEVVEKRNLLVIRVPGGQNRPYKAPDRATGKHKTWHHYIRRGSSTIEAKGDIEQELWSLAHKIPFDDRYHPTAKVEALSPKLILNHLRETGSELADDALTLPLETLGRQMNLIGGSSEFPYPKNVGLLLFNDAPDAFFPLTQIDVVWFPDGAGGDDFEETIFKGPLVRMTREALDHIRRNYLRETVIKQKQRAEALRVWNFPFAAVEEALVNAVYHRSYEDQNPIEVRISPDELAVLSFPGPDRSIQLADLQAGRAVSRRYRNRRIGDFLKELKLSEGRATGVPKIFKAMAKNGSPPPIFESDDERIAFVIRLPVHPLSLTGSQNTRQHDIDESTSTSTDQTATIVTPEPRVMIDIDRIIKYAPEQLIGREAEIALLDAAWDKVINDDKPRAHLITLVGLGGEGKTALLANWAAQLASRGWPGCEAVFAWSFYSQGPQDKIAASADLFINEALRFFGDAALAASAVSSTDKARHLISLVGARRTLLILDGIEPLQYAPTSPLQGALKDAGLVVLLKGLAAANQGLCVLTTRYSISDLTTFWNTTVSQIALTRLPEAAGVALLRTLGVVGTQKEFLSLVNQVKGHALSLNLSGAYLRDAYGGDIRQFDLINLKEADEEEQGGHAFRVMDAYVAWLASDDMRGRRALAVLRLLGLFDRPARFDCITALLQAPGIIGLTDDLSGISAAQLNLTLTRLQGAGLLTVQRDAAGGLMVLDTHPLLREYFASQLITENSAAWQSAHRCLYTWLCANTLDSPEPTLHDLQPLYQAVAHGCLAGLHQVVCDEVYLARILRGSEHYSTRKLGALGADLGALACFFVQPWQRLAPALREETQAWLLHHAAFCLRALGRLSEAAEPMRAAFALNIRLENWSDAATSANNLAGLGQTLGDLAGALQYAEQAVNYGELSGNAFLRIGMRASHADALYQAGQPLAAKALFSEAEAMQAEWQPQQPLLASLWGFWYCELLLAEPEAAAWQLSVQRHAIATGPVPVDTAEAMQPCHLVSQRAAQTLAWSTSQFTLLDIALDQLTLGRAALFAAILAGQPLAPCQATLSLALDGLRRAGDYTWLPHGLLTRAWLLAETGYHSGPDSAQTDLDEAWEIAERGPMPLFMADIHLYRAGLFHHLPVYPWQSAVQDAQEARRLIAKHGYLGRMVQLEALEQAIGIV